MKKILIYLIFLIPFLSFSQLKIDSLKTIWKDDTSSVKNKIFCFSQIVTNGNLTETEIFIRSSINALITNKQTNLLKQVSPILTGNKTKLSISKKYEFLEEISAFFQIENEIHNMAITCADLAVLHFNIGDSTGFNQYAKKMDSLFDLVSNDAHNDLKFAGYNKLGFRFYNYKQFDYSLYLYQKAIKFCEDYPIRKGAVLIWFGNNYAAIEKYDSAIYYHRLALDGFLSIKSPFKIAESYRYLSYPYWQLKKYDEAIMYLDSSIHYFFESNRARPKEEFYGLDRIGLMMSYRAQIYLEQEKFDKAIKEYEIIFSNYEDYVFNKTPGALINIYTNASSCYKKQGKYDLAYTYLLKHFDLREELDEQEKLNELNFTKNLNEINAIKEKSIVDKEMMNQELAINLKIRNIILFSSLTIVGILGLFIWFILKNLKIKKKTNQEIINQKKRIEEAHIEITDSIEYAKRIQAAILPSKNKLQENLPDSFVIYKPKNVVAGDFYWTYRASNKILIAVADCTGHGVPGAMVSVFCNNALNRSVREFGLTDPGDILNKTRTLIVEEFSKSHYEISDGMDIALCCIDNGNLHFAGANNPLWIVNHGNLTEIKGDKQPVGRFIHNKNYSTHSMSIHRGDSFYIFSDGYIDQFGGELNKKYKAAKLKSFLSNISHEKMQDQKKLLELEFRNWIGENDQVDDVCMIGFKYET